MTILKAINDGEKKINLILDFVTENDITNDIKSEVKMRRQNKFYWAWKIYFFDLTMTVSSTLFFK